MARYLILLAATLINAGIVFLALVPSLVTYAEVVPQGVQCNLCATPEIQRAIISAATAGRGQIISLIQSNSTIITAACALNWCLFVALLFFPKWLGLSSEGSRNVS